MNIADRSRKSAVGKLLVDTGSDYTWLPAKLLEKIGLNARRRISR